MINPRYLERFVRETIGHSLRVEYYIFQLRIPTTDTQRPHDIVGRNNKLELNIAEGMAHQYLRKTKKNKVEIEEKIRTAVNAHRQQYHHKAFGIHNQDYNHPDVEAVAVDGICSLLENRVYQGGTHSWNEFELCLYSQRGREHVLFRNLINRMRRLPEPEICIDHLDKIKNPGISSEMFDRLKQRTYDARLELQIDHIS